MRSEKYHLYARLAALGLAALLFAGPSAMADDKKADDEKTEKKAEGDEKLEPTAPLTIAGVMWDVPTAWKPVRAHSPMRKAQLSLPGESGDAEFVIYHFGRGEGGGTQANIQRWASQFKSDGHGTPTPETKTIEANGLKSTIVDVVGTYAPAPMMGGAAAAPKPDYALYGVIVEGGPEGSLFVKVTGPKKTIDHWKKELDRYTKSGRPAKK